MRMRGRGWCLVRKQRSLRAVRIGMWSCTYLQSVTSCRLPSGELSRSMMTWQHSSQRKGQFSTRTAPMRSYFWSAIGLPSRFQTVALTWRACSSSLRRERGTVAGKMVQYSSMVMQQGIQCRGSRSGAQFSRITIRMVLSDQFMYFFRGVMLRMTWSAWMGASRRNRPLSSSALVCSVREMLLVTSMQGTRRWCSRFRAWEEPGISSWDRTRVPSMSMANPSSWSQFQLSCSLCISGYRWAGQQYKQ